MEILDQLSRLAEQAEVVQLRSESTTVSFEANRLKSAEVSETAGTAVRVVHNGRLGFAASSDDSAQEKLISNALESASFGDELQVSFPGPQAATLVATNDERISRLSVDAMVEIGQQAIDLLLQAEPEAQVSVEVTRGAQHVQIWNQTGTQVALDRTPLSISIQASRVSQDDVLLVYDSTGSTIWDGCALAGARRLARKLELAREQAPVKSGRMPVLFAPTGALILLLPLLQGVNGKSVYSGVSPMAGKLGQRLFDEILTLVDDPLLDGRYASASHDDEGVPHRRNVLIDQGQLRGFVYDLKTAAQSGVESTGNGSRSLFSAPQPSTTNLVLQAGETPLAEMIASIKEGLLVDHALGLGQGNTISGAFSNSLSLAFKIENGEIVGRAKDVSIAGNVYDLLGHVEAISSESEWVHHSLKLPYILLPEMNVVAK